MTAGPAIRRTPAPRLLDGLDPRAELLRILAWWAGHAVDRANGGFHGEIDAEGRPVSGAGKGVVLNARLLWFFSAAGQRLRRDDALDLARRAFDYLVAHFVDPVHGGVCWSVDAEGRIAGGRKQAYAQAFAIYGLAEYHAATGDPEALRLAKDLRDRVETRFWDGGRGGYVEATDRDWSALADQRLSERDLNCPKTMNTHLHILEACTRLYQVSPDAATRDALRRVLEVFLDRFVDGEGRHLRLFLDMDWTDRSHAISFGHDIEASWLLREAADALDEADLLRRVRPVVLGLAKATLNEGVLPDGGLAHERDFGGHLDTDGEWWVQAEGLVGFVNAWQLTGDGAYAAAADRLWARIVRDFIGTGGTEWTWYAAGSPRLPLPLAGLWKCPYHNGRAMLELMRRLGRS